MPVRTGIGGRRVSAGRVPRGVYANDPLKVKNVAAKERRQRRNHERARAALGPGVSQQTRAALGRDRKGIGGNVKVEGGEGIGGNFQAGLGQQLSSRVDSGAIDQERAEQTARERAMFAKAFGKNWRQHVYGSVGALKNARKSLAEGSTDPNVAAFYKKLMEERQRMLAIARERAGA